MSQSMQLWLYALVVFGVIVLPGLDMAFVLASSVVGGRRAGLAAVAGIMAGGVCHMGMGALGMAIVLRLWPALFNALLLAGAGYVAWIGWSLLRTRAGTGMQLGTAQRSAAMTFWRAMLTSLMNPKAYVFMLAVVPQFIRPAAGPVWLQAIALAAITAAIQAGVYGSLALVSGRAGAWLSGRPDQAAVVARLIGALLALSALLAGLQGWQQVAAR
jgi:threonine/homoserine/homoserine lactone efflux protein